MKRTLSSFDPGPNSAKRWDVAFEAAQVARSFGPFVLEVDGVYALAERLVLRKQMTIVGGDPSCSQLIFTTVGEAGIKVTRPAAESSFHSLRIRGPSPFLGADCGLQINGALCVARDLILENWSGAGLACIGDVTNDTNANGCDFSNVRAVACGHGGAPDGQPMSTGSGFYFVGGDANASALVGCKAYDCRKGFLDASFLGNSFVACAAEGCTNRFDRQPTTTVGTSFQTVDPNCRSSFTGCYTEADSPGRVNLPSTIRGGFFINIGTALVEPDVGAAGRFPVKHVSTDEYTGRATTVTSELGGDQPGAAMSFAAADQITGMPLVYPTIIRFNEYYRAWMAQWANLDNGYLFGFSERDFWVNNLRLGNRMLRVFVAPSLEAALASGPSDGKPWAIGDRVMVETPSAGDPASYVMTSAGWKVCGRVEL